MSSSHMIEMGTPIRSPSFAASIFFMILLLANSSQVFLVHYQDELLAMSTVVSLLGMYYYRKIPSLMFLFFTASLLIWIGFIVVQYDVWNIKTCIGFLFRIFLAYAVVVILRDRFFPVLLEVVYKLTVISIPLYLIGLLAPEVMLQLHSILNLMPDVFIIDYGEYYGWPRANFLLYTFSIERIYQNHGFMWEPTAFAGVLLFTMMIHLTLNHCKPDKRFKVFLLALVTTVSTTGFIALATVMMFILINGKTNYKVLTGFAFIILASFFFSLDIGSGKIEKEFSRWDEVSTANPNITMAGNSRLSSFIYDLRDFADHPLIGLGIFEENRYSGHQRLGSVNGVGDTLSRFGIILSLLFLSNLILSFKRFSRDNHTRGYFLFVLLFLLISWSERLTMLPLFFAFQFYWFLPRYYDKTKIMAIRVEESFRRVE